MQIRSVTVWPKDNYNKRDKYNLQFLDGLPHAIVESCFYSRTAQRFHRIDQKTLIPKGVASQLIGEVLKRQDIDVVFCSQYRPMGINDNPSPDTLKLGNGT